VGGEVPSKKLILIFDILLPAILARVTKSHGENSSGVEYYDQEGANRLYPSNSGRK
jgi:hypothetical protein